MPDQPTVTLPRDLARAALTALAWWLSDDVGEDTQPWHKVMESLGATGRRDDTPAETRLYDAARAALAEIGKEGDHDA